MNILLIMPKIFPRIGIDYNYTFPLGICYISSVMKQAGYNVDCLNLNHKDGLPEEILRPYFDKKKYDVVAMGSVWMGFAVVKELVKVTRMYSPQSKIIIGGSLMTSKPELVMKELHPDFGIIGEGEETILDLLKCIKNNGDFSKVKGITFSGITTEKRIPTNNINDIIYPDLESFEFEKYLNEMYTNQQYQNNILDYPRTYNVLGARGCPFQCTFCYHSSKYRERSIDSVVDELEWAISKFKINIINIFDDTFSINKKRVDEFCGKVKELGILWTCQMNVNCIDEEMIKKMKDCGCFLISYGFESYDKNVLRSMKKPITPEQIDFAIKTTMKNNIGIQGNFIFGDPEESIESIQTTLKYWKENCKGQVRLSFIQPYAGSEIYDYCVREGMIKDELKYMSKDIYSTNAIKMTKNMSSEQFQWLIDEIKTLEFSGYFRNVIPKEIYVINPEKNRYAVKIDCPFCEKEVVYENYYFKPQEWFKDYMMCRECKMRFNICKPIIK